MSSRPSHTPFHSLMIQDYSCQVRLGCHEGERAVTQEVRFSVEFRFHEAPKGIRTDEIENTICYAEVCEVLRVHCASGEFKLIERLAVECYELLRDKVLGQASLSLTLHKVRPPVDDLHGGSFYRCGDFLP